MDNEFDEEINGVNLNKLFTMYGGGQGTGDNSRMKSFRGGFSTERGRAEFP